MKGGVCKIACKEDSLLFVIAKEETKDAAEIGALFRQLDADVSAAGRRCALIQPGG